MKLSISKLRQIISEELLKEYPALARRTRGMKSLGGPNAGQRLNSKGLVMKMLDEESQQVRQHLVNQLFTMVLRPQHQHTLIIPGNQQPLPFSRNEVKDAVTELSFKHFGKTPFINKLVAHAFQPDQGYAHLLASMIITSYGFGK